MTILDTTSHDHFLHDLKSRIRAARTRAALSVNRELILLYWQIGRDILERQKREDWGAKVIERLATDLRTEFQDMKGLLPRNLLFMRAFAEGYTDEEKVKQLVSQLPWGACCPAYSEGKITGRARMVYPQGIRTWLVARYSGNAD